MIKAFYEKCDVVVYLLLWSALSDVTANKDLNWDYLLFSLRWPITGCSQWRENNPKNTCNLPNDTMLWTVHGIWPTKIKSGGPNFCNSSLHFNKTAIEILLPDLQAYWPNIEANTKKSSFWKHEWRKHGTCAVQLDSLDTEVKYFSQGLEWVRNYNMGKILLENGVVPMDTGYKVNDIFYAVRNNLSKVPSIQCVVDKETNQSMISEIRLCFDKNLTLIDCDVKKLKKEQYDFVGNDTILTNCKLDQLIIYPAVPVNETKGLEFEETNSFFEAFGNLLELYKLLLFLIWMTI